MEQEQERWAEGPGLVASLLRYRWAILALTILAGVAGYVLSSQQPPQFTATAHVLLDDPRDPGLLGSADAARFVDPERFFAQQAQKMASPAVLDVAAADLGGAVTAEGIARSVDASADPDLNLVTVTSTRSSATDAAAFANAVSEAYRTVAADDTQQQAERAVAAIEDQLVELRSQAEEAEAAAAADPEDTVAASRARILTERIIAMEGTAGDIATQAAVTGSGVEGIREAAAPEEPSAPQPVRDAAIAAVLAFILAAILAYWRAGQDSSIKTSAEPARILGAPLLGEVPRYRLADPGTVAGRLTVPPAAVEAFQFVLASVEYALADVASAAVLVTSASAGDGKTVSALQLSLAARRDNRAVTLVDGDLRAQGLTTLLAANDSPGLSNLIKGDASPAQTTKRYRIENDVILPVVTAGERTEDPGVLLRGGGLGPALQTLREDSRLVIMDSPPMLAVVDASVAAAHVDGIVLVVSPETSQDQLRKLKERLAFVSTPVLGYIYNRAESDLGAYDYYGPNTAQTTRWAKLRGRGGSARLPAPVSNGRGERARTRV